jgi:hypothetical protein
MFRLFLPLWVVLFSCLSLRGSPQENLSATLKPATIVIDMVHDNPGEKSFVTHYNDPDFIASLGYQGKVYELFKSAQFGIDWSSVDPDVFPENSPGRAWVDKKAAELDQLYNSMKSQGLKVYAHTDMVVLPRELIKKYHLEDTYGDINNQETQKYLRLLVRQIFDRFPQLDGLVVRIGETYLNGAPYHAGKIKNKTDPNHTVIPLINLLREEVCVKLGKKLFFRTWLSFDTDIDKYETVSQGVEPHPNLYFVVKHCEGDFFRGNPFSKVLGIGRHPQVIEIQCQREYEGKGAYPNYIANGVIEGFEEHNGQSIRKIWVNPLVAGMLTWSRGGGWGGPYITNELWCDLNVYVLVNWAQNPNQAEGQIFDKFAATILKLDAKNTALFRELCLLSAKAAYRGTRSTQNDIQTGWTRDDVIGVPILPKDLTALQRVLAEQDQAVTMWQRMVEIADELQISDADTKQYVQVSCLYGYYLYQIYRDIFYLESISPEGDKNRIRELLNDYDQAWENLRRLKEQNKCCATLYREKGPHMRRVVSDRIDVYRKAIE